MIFRLIITIYIYIIPFLPSTPDSLMALAKLLIPLFILGFIRLLYEKKRKYAKEVKSTKSGNIIFAATICLMISLVMLISNQFRFGMVVIATDSMNDEIKSGDIVVFEKFTNDDIISIGQIIVFKKEDTLIIHRVVDIKHIDGVMQYYTKGDANEKNDDGFITKNDIVGYVNFLDLVHEEEQSQLKAQQGDYYYSDTFHDVLFVPEEHTYILNVDSEEVEMSFYEKVRYYNVVNDW